MIEKKKPDYSEICDFSIAPFIKLKVLLFLTKITEITYDQIQYLDGADITSYDYILKIVNIKMAVYRILNLLNQEKELSNFQYQSINILNNYLKDQILDGTIPKMNLNKKFGEEILDAVVRSNELEYPDMPECHYCKENILLNITNS